MVYGRSIVLKTLWIVYTGLLVLLPFGNALPISAFTNSTQMDMYQAYIRNVASVEDFDDISATCKQIEKSISHASQVFYAIDPSYYEDIKHYVASSTTFSVCSVEPATTVDVAIIMKIIRQTRVPFAVKGGGHSANPGFSSTTGVHIAMRRFRKTIFHANNQTVDVGPGLVWNDVYTALEPHNVSVLGGRVSGVGVAGFTLGGGYGWKSNQYGLAIDNVFEYELVTPNGTIVYVNNISYPDIFFGLKGGLNNFGIVTNFNIRALPQTEIYGGFLVYTADKFDRARTAVVNFQNMNKDPKAQIIPSFTSQDGIVVFNVIVFYDAPTAPKDYFKQFMDIHPIGTLKTRSFLSLIQASPVFITDNMRGRFNTVSFTNVTTGLLQKAEELCINYTKRGLPKLGTLVSFSLEPFLSTYFDKSQGGAYPHFASSTPPLPIYIMFSWLLPVDDDFFVNEIKSATDSLQQAALADGQYGNGTSLILYPNYALEKTPLSEMYGNNTARLQRIRQAWDPENIMYLAGGFKF